MIVAGSDCFLAMINMKPIFTFELAAGSHFGTASTLMPANYSTSYIVIVEKLRAIA